MVKSGNTIISKIIAEMLTDASSVRPTFHSPVMELQDILHLKWSAK